MALNLPARADLGVFPTPLRREPALANALGMFDLWAKRDDLTGFSWGGNKVRTAQFLISDAVRSGVTDLVVAGGPSSNFAAIIAAAGPMFDIEIHQVSYGSEPAVKPPALRAALTSGANIRFTGSNDRSMMEVVADDLARELCGAGRVAVALPRGGANSVGVNGFVAAAFELHEQLNAAELSDPTIVLPVGSGGSIAGLLAGRALLDSTWPIVGASVSRTTANFEDLILNKATMAARALGWCGDPSTMSRRFHLVDCVGSGFGTLTSAEAEFRRDIQNATGLLVDHTYNTKPLHWLARRADALDGPHLYWLTGGALGAWTHLEEPEQ